MSVKKSPLPIVMNATKSRLFFPFYGFVFVPIYSSTFFYLCLDVVDRFIFVTFVQKAVGRCYFPAFSWGKIFKFIFLCKNTTCILIQDMVDEKHPVKHLVLRGILLILSIFASLYGQSVLPMLLHPEVRHNLLLRYEPLQHFLRRKQRSYHLRCYRYTMLSLQPLQPLTPAPC